MENKCLIVIKNHKGGDIQPTIELPAIFCQLDLTLGHITDFIVYIHRIKDYVKTLWIPKSVTTQLTTNFSKDWTTDICQCSFTLATALFWTTFTLCLYS